MKSGELRFAAGVSNRKNSFSYTPFYDDASIIENPIGLFASNTTAGSTEVSELYGELLLPVTKKLDLELGYRYSDYDTKAAAPIRTRRCSTVATGKMRLRGGFQRAVRAPNTASSFQGPTLIVCRFAPSDPCSYTTSVPWGNTGPNTAKRSQRAGQPAATPGPAAVPTDHRQYDVAFGAAGSATANNFARPGAPFFRSRSRSSAATPTSVPRRPIPDARLRVQRPGSLENLTASVDIYNIEITDAIANLNSLFVYASASTRTERAIRRSRSRPGWILRKDRRNTSNRRACPSRRAVQQLGYF